MEINIYSLLYKLHVIFRKTKFIEKSTYLQKILPSENPFGVGNISGGYYDSCKFHSVSRNFPANTTIIIITIIQHLMYR